MDDLSKLITVRYHAESMAHAATAAYWSTGHRDYQMNEMHLALTKAADEMGFYLAPKEFDGGMKKADVEAKIWPLIAWVSDGKTPSDTQIADVIDALRTLHRDQAIKHHLGDAS